MFLGHRPALTLVLALAAPAAGAEPAATFVREWGGHGDKPGQFDFPIGVAVTPKGELLVSDFYNARVQRFAADGKFLAAFPTFPNPGGIAVDPDGNFYLAHFPAMKATEEKKPDRVSAYSPEGKRLREWGKTGTGDGEFDYPGGLAIGKGGRVYVADQTNRRVQAFDRDGKFLLKWGEYGVKEGQFGGNVSAKSRVGGPQFLAIDKDGNVYTTEGSVGRVQKFTADGKFLLAWGDNEDRAGSFGGRWEGRPNGLRGPVGICLDGKGTLWVTSVGGRVQRFTTDGKYLGGFGGPGTEPGKFRAPHGVAADGKGNLYVIDSFNHRVQQFRVTD